MKINIIAAMADITAPQAHESGWPHYQTEAGAGDVESAGEVVAKKFDDKRLFSVENFGALSMVSDVEKWWPTDKLQSDILDSQGLIMQILEVL